jgi:hypothetical protein
VQFFRSRARAAGRKRLALIGQSIGARLSGFWIPVF